MYVKPKGKIDVSKKSEKLKVSKKIHKKPIIKPKVHKKPIIKPIMPERTIASVRTIVHLSDLHIGKNDRRTEIKAAYKLISQIISTYRNEDPKPIIVITGDIVDYGKKKYFDIATKILKPLLNNGFTVLPVPGNHDYSSDLNTYKIAPLLKFVPIVSEVFEIIVNELASDRGYRRDKITGINIHGGAVSRFREWQRSTFLPDWSEGHIYHYKEEHPKPLKNLNFILLDNQDLNSDAPTWADALLVSKGLFLHNEEFRAAKGYVNKDQIKELAALLANTDSSDYLIMCTHYWIDYYLENYYKSTDQEQTIYILTLMRQCDGNGSKVPVSGPSSIQEDLFELLARGIPSYGELMIFRKAVTGIFPPKPPTSPKPPKYTEGRRYDAEPEPLGKPRMTFRDHNPTLDSEEHKNHKIINEEQLFSALERSKILLVGHRHNWTDLQELLPVLKDKLKLHQDRLANYIPLQANTSKKQVKDFLGDIAFFRRNYSIDLNRIKLDLIELIAHKVVSCNLRYDADAKYREHKNKILNYYCESGPSTRNNAWIEIKINLYTGKLNVKTLPKPVREGKIGGGGTRSTESRPKHRK